MKRCIYTCVMGDYEELQNLNIELSSNITPVCFTDNKKLQSKKWEIIYMNNTSCVDSVKKSRHIKILGHDHLNQFDELMWVDNSVLIRKDPSGWFDNYLTESNFAVPIHSSRENLSQEFYEVMKLGYTDPYITLKQIRDYEQENANVLDLKVYWTGIFLRRNTGEIKEVFRLWFNELMKYGNRDQLSLPFILSKANIDFRQIEIDNNFSEVHEWPRSINRKIINREPQHIKLINLLGKLHGTKINELNKNNIKLTEEILNHRKLIKELELLLKQLQDSKSVRITKPLRILRKRIDRIKNANI